MHRFQRFWCGSGTGRPVCGSSGSRPIGTEPEPEPVMTAVFDRQRFQRSGTANGSRDWPRPVAGQRTNSQSPTTTIAAETKSLNTSRTVDEKFMGTNGTQFVWSVQAEFLLQHGWLTGGKRSPQFGDSNTAPERPDRPQRERRENIEWPSVRR